MRKRHILCVCLLPLLVTGAALADSTSYVGTLADPNSVFEATLTLGATANVTLQTYGFGGGTNQAGTVIAAGGTDPFVGLFDSSGDLINGTSLDLTNFNAGCPPANSVSNFGDTTCGDVTLNFAALAAGTYTVLLSDGQFIPFAAFGGNLSDGFLDLTAGVFCNLTDVNTNTNCPNTSGAFALDVITGGSVVSTPEPVSLLLLSTGLAGMATLRKRKTT